MLGLADCEEEAGPSASGNVAGISSVLIIGVVKDVVDASLMSIGLEGVEVGVGLESPRLTV